MFSHKGSLPSGRILAFMISHRMTFFYPFVSTFMIASSFFYKIPQDFIACFKSAITSSAFSKPTLKRKNPSW